MSSSIIVKHYADENNNNGENSIIKQQPTINRHRRHRRGPLVPLHISANDDTKDNNNSIIDNSNVMVKIVPYAIMNV